MEAFDSNSLLAKVAEFRCMMKRLKSLVFGKLHRRRIERLNKKSGSQLEIAKRKRKADKIYEQMKALQNEDTDRLTCHMLREFGNITPIVDEQLPALEKAQYMMVYWAMKDQAVSDAVIKFRLEYPTWKDILPTLIITKQHESDRGTSSVNDHKQDDSETPQNNNSAISKKRKLNQRKKKQKLRKMALFEALQSVTPGNQVVNDTDPDVINSTQTTSDSVVNEPARVNDVVNESATRSGSKKVYEMDKNLVPRHIYHQKLREVRRRVRGERMMKCSRRKLVRREGKLMEVRQLDLRAQEGGGPGGNQVDQELDAQRPGGKRIDQELDMQRPGGNQGDQELDSQRPGGRQVDQELDTQRPCGKRVDQELDTQRPGGKQVDQELDTQRLGERRVDQELDTYPAPVRSRDSRVSDSFFMDPAASGGDDRRATHRVEDVREQTTADYGKAKRNPQKNSRQQERVDRNSSRSSIRSTSNNINSNKLHPSWEAKRLAAERSSSAMCGFKGTRVTFDDSDDE